MGGIVQTGLGNKPFFPSLPVAGCRETKGISLFVLNCEASQEKFVHDIPVIPTSALQPGKTARLRELLKPVLLFIISALL